MTDDAKDIRKSLPMAADKPMPLEFYNLGIDTLRVTVDLQPLLCHLRLLQEP